jgi:hypothetical protein
MKPPEEEQEFHHRHAAHGSGFKGGTRRDRVVISTVVIGVALFLLGTPYIKRYLATEGVVVNSIGNGDVDPIGSGQVDAETDHDPDREAVRRWLRENGDDPHPHEIRWWPSRELSKLHQLRLDAAREVAEDDPSWASQVKQLEKDGPDRVCRLQYRNRNEAGEEITRDDLFILREGKARLLAKDSSFAIAARRSFPDGEGGR